MNIPYYIQRLDEEYKRGFSDGFRAGHLAALKQKEAGKDWVYEADDEDIIEDD